MGKNKKKSRDNNKSKPIETPAFWKKIITLELKEEIKKTIVGIICLGISLLLVLSFFKLAGPLGENIYKIFLYLFGWLYFFTPLFFISAGIIFLGSLRQHIYGSTAFGLIFSALGILGISDILKSGSTGIVGQGLGALEKILGYWGGLVVFIILTIVGLVIVFEFSLKKETEDEEEEEKIKPIKNEKPIIKPIIPEKMEIKEPKKEPEIKMPEEPAKPSIKNEKINIKKDIGNWNFPPLEILEMDSGKPLGGDVKANAAIIQRTLANFGIPVEMDEVHIGPTVTRYSLKPAEGVKLARIITLQNDLSLALAAHPIRIEAPIPGKSLVGIEMPNKTKAEVRMRNVLSMDKFWDSTLLTVPLGRDVSGEPIFIDLAKMPHLLVAGSTGSGKSVAIHSLILSLLYKNTPETLRLLLVDPKRVELTAYNNLPHLVSEVIINPKKTVAALRWAVTEMDRRYNELMEAKSRDIISYNNKALKEKKPIMPYIVIVIDELADLMAAYGREVEGSIVRLAQMARAIGIHLIVSTQRPSVEVITGLIKANITSRIALQVASQIDSRTILDTSGAEKLLGRGDMLYLAPEASKPKRIQGVFVSETEVAKTNKYIIENNKDYVSEGGIFEESENENDSGIQNSLPGMVEFSDNDADGDELYPDAYKIVVEAGKASASFLQRRLRVGYARAARLLDILEQNGVIGPGEGAKPREVLVQKNRTNINDPIEPAKDKMPKEDDSIEVEEINDEEEKEE